MELVLHKNMQQVELPLIQRLQMGPQYCTPNEWEACLWLQHKLYSPYQGFRKYTDYMKHVSSYFGVCGMVVPFAPQNPQRPWIVNAIMEQMGAVLYDYSEQTAIAGPRIVGESIRFTYKTSEEGIVFTY